MKTKFLRKALRKYVAEFIILFLAVFLGFVAENYRENISEKNQDERLMQEFFLELKADSLGLQEIIAAQQHAELGIDSITVIRNLDFRNNVNRNEVVKRYFRARAWSAHGFSMSSSALSQLKNTGALSRLSSNIVKLLILYDKDLGKNDFLINNYYRHTEETNRMTYRFFDTVSTQYGDFNSYKWFYFNDSEFQIWFNYMDDLKWTIVEYREFLTKRLMENSELASAIRSEHYID